MLQGDIEIRKIRKRESHRKRKCLSVVKQYAKKHGVNVKHIKKILEL